MRHTMDNPTTKDGGNGNAEAPVVQLLITYNLATHNCSLSGPLEDDAVFFDLLKIAALTYSRARAKGTEPTRIIAPNVVQMPKIS